MILKSDVEELALIAPQIGAEVTPGPVRPLGDEEG